MESLFHTLQRLQSALDAHAPSRDTDNDADLTEENDQSRMIELGLYFDAMPTKPFVVVRSDQIAFIGKIPIVLHDRHVEDMHFTVHHDSGGYRVDFYSSHSVTSKTYQGMDAQRLFAAIIAESNDIFRQWMQFVNVF